MGIEKTITGKFFRVDGGNGASFFFSTLSWKAWRKSLEFYRAVSFRAGIKKLLLTLAYPLFKFKAISGKTVESIVQKELGIQIATENNSSVMISPTRDKVILHRHLLGYEKTAVGKSLPGVRQELEVYRLLTRQMAENFTFSRLGNVDDSENHIRFFMHYAQGVFSEKIPPAENLVAPLIEFFTLNGIKTSPWNTLWDDLLKDNSDLIPYVSGDMRQSETPVGLVHRDFKPWNVKAGNKPLFFDFESASFNGCPLEDLFNYEIAPLIGRKSTAELRNFAHRSLFPVASDYLKLMNIPQSELCRYWRWYLLERTVFWRMHGKNDAGQSFLNIYE